MEYIVVGGFYSPGRTPQIVNVVKDKIALGYMPYGTPALIESSGFLAQAMIKGGGGNITDYAILKGFTDKSPYLPVDPPAGAAWGMLGSLVRRADSFNIQVWVQGEQIYPGFALDLASAAVTGVLPINKGGTGANTLAGARTALQVNRIGQAGSETNIVSPDGTKKIFVTNTDWGAFDITANSYMALPVNRGGTGALTAADARTGLQIPFRRYDTLTSTDNINNFRGTVAGDFPNSLSANASTANGYPEASAGSLQVYQNLANNADSCSQCYLPYNNTKLWRRNFNTSSWGEWMHYGRVLPPVRMTASSDWNTAFQYGTQQTFGTGALALNAPGSDVNYGVIEIVGSTVETTGPNLSFMLQRMTSKDAPYIERYRLRNDNNTNWSPWQTVWHISGLTYTGATTVDANGFIKTASPIIILSGDGTSTLNDESEGAQTSRISQGEYMITGVLGFNSDTTWHVEVPKDINGQPLIWVDYTVAADGSITIRTFHREHPNAPEFARNAIPGLSDGSPIDIPSGKCLTLRVNMPDL